MAAKLSKWITTVCLLALLTALTAAAGENHTRSPNQEQARQLARERMAQTIVALEARMETCEAKQRTLSKTDLEGVDISRDHLRTALVYFHVRNENACMEDKAKDFLLATYLLEEAGVLENLGDTTQSELASFVMHTYWQELEHEVRYRALPEKAREKLEAVEALQTPFKLIESGEALGVL